MTSRDRYWVHSDPAVEPGDTSDHRCERLHCRADHGQPALTPRTFCDGCTQAVKTALAELPELYVQLHAELAPGSGTGAPHVSGSREAPLPLRTGHAALIDDIDFVLAQWEDQLRDHLEHSRPPRSPIAPARRDRRRATLSGAVTYLGVHLAPLLALDQVVIRRWVDDDHGGRWAERLASGADAGDELLQLTARARRALSLTRLVHHLPAPCPSCEQLSLQRESGDEQVLCTYCRRTWSEAEYQRLVVVLSSETRARGHTVLQAWQWSSQLLRVVAVVNGLRAAR